MDDIVGELRDCAADSAEVGYKSRAQVAMLRAADDIVALQGRIVRQCQSVNELVAATEKCIEERDRLRAEVDAFREDAANYYRVAKEADAQQAALRARVAEAERQLRALVFNTHTAHDLAKAKEDAVIWLTPRAGVAGNKEASRNGNT